MHPLYNLSTPDQAVAMLTVKVNGNDKNIIVCASYFPHEAMEGPPNSEYAAVVEYCKENNLPLLSGIDANAHHFAWGSTDINPRGSNLFEFILATELRILNVLNQLSKTN